MLEGSINFSFHCFSNSYVDFVLELIAVENRLEFRTSLHLSVIL